MLYFKHSGLLGDIIYSLPAMIEISRNYGFEKFNLFVVKNQIANRRPDLYHPGGLYRLSEDMANFILPLLKSISYINSVEVVADGTTPPYAIDLDTIRTAGLNTYAGNVMDYYFKTFGLIHRDCNPWIHIEPSTLMQKYQIVIGRTTRYLNQGINYSALNSSGMSIGYLGNEKEFEIFRGLHPIAGMERIPVADALEAAQYIKNSSVYIGNQSFMFAIAEAMQAPRILETYEEIPNVVPRGGVCGQFLSTHAMIRMVNRITGASIDEDMYPNGAPQYLLSM